MNDWNELKKMLQRNAKTIPFREREIWWYAAGENLGSEINGKGERFSRPILIIRKYGATTFFGVPLSTRKATGFWYASVMVGNNEGCALLSQASSFSVFRLYERIDRLSEAEFNKICLKLGKLLLKITP